MERSWLRLVGCNRRETVKAYSRDEPIFMTMVENAAEGTNSDSTKKSDSTATANNNISSLQNGVKTEEPHEAHESSHYLKRSSDDRGRHSCKKATVTDAAAKTATQKSVLLSKIIFFTFLFLVAALAGGLLYKKLTQTEQQFAKSQFQSNAQRALKDCSDVLFRKRLSAESMATVIGQHFYNASEWPFVIMNGFDEIVERLSSIGSHNSMGFSPIVKVGYEQEKWEEFVYNYFDTRIASGDFPNTTGINEFGKGIWRNEDTDNGTIRVHDNDNVTLSQGILAPLVQCCVDNPGDPVLLFNEYSEKNRREAIDRILECFDSQTDAISKEMCWAMTNFVNVQHINLTRALASIMFQPIMPASNLSTVAGFVLFPMKWVDIFDNVFSDDVSGVHCVLESYYPEDGIVNLHEGHNHPTPRQTFTFTIKDGNVVSVEEGDLHQTKYDALDQNTNLTLSLIPNMVQYGLHLYPTEDLIKSYSTNNPRDATICALFVVALVTILFLSYDYFVQREFHERRQVLEAKRRFIRYVSHEVRSPLNAVLMGLNIIQNDEEDFERKSLIQDIQNSANSAVTVLNEVLQYDKIEENKLQLELSILDIWALVSTQLLDFKALAESNNIQLKLAYDIPSRDNSDVEYGMLTNVDDLPANVRNLRVVGDVPKILQVLRNLISNALKFTPERGLILLTISHIAENTLDEEKNKKTKRRDINPIEKITLNCGEEILATRSGYFCLDVIDNGVGMSDGQISRLFGEGVQFNANDLQEGKGSGLGLFISKNLVEQHGGCLTATSEGLGKGSVFTVRLPLYECSVTSTPDENQIQEESFSGSSSYHERKQLRILVVDDIATNRKLLSRLLERNNHKCFMAENGEIAVNMVRDNMSINNKEERFDAVLMDYEMPVLNGPNATQQIREMGSDVLIVGITGNTLRDDVLHFESKGANMVLSKPVNLDVLENLFVEFLVDYRM